MKPDGRNINKQLGTLSGEASQMQGERIGFSGTGPWPVQNKSSDTYYNRPLLKKSPWSWDIPAYYYIGGTTGGLMTLGAASTILNRDELKGLIKKSRYLATTGAALSAALLIHDLGRPSRFLNMLRVFRPTSPMSMGTWILMSFSGLTGLSLITKNNTAAITAGILGLALSGYTGVLISNTTVPIWHQPHRLMPILFLASGASSAASFFNLLEANEQEQKAARLYGIAGKIVEITTVHLIEKEVGTIPEVARPLYEGVSGKLWQAAKILTAASLALSLIPKPSRNLTRLTGILGTAGAICMRFGIHYAGQDSSDNPRAAFHQQRQALKEPEQSQ